ncbi:lytic transglycosylase domain-containing protein [archaeon]|nr:lytic transglycosylase domain-containing protein [archaeon]
MNRLASYGIAFLSGLLFTFMPIKTDNLGSVGNANNANLNSFSKLERQLQELDDISPSLQSQTDDWIFKYLSNINRLSKIRDRLVEVECPVQEYARKYNMEEKIINGMIGVESNGYPFAVSKKGAIGLMQIIPSTGRRLGIHYHELFDSAESIDGGVRYLVTDCSFGIGEFSLPFALLAYHGGPGRIGKLIEMHGFDYDRIISHLAEMGNFKDTINYPPQVLAMAYLLGLLHEELLEEHASLYPPQALSKKELKAHYKDG